MHFSRIIAGAAIANSVLLGFGQAALFGGSKVLWWGIPIIIQGSGNPPVPIGVPAPSPAPPAPQACPASCAVTRTLAAVTTTLPAVTTTLPAVTTTMPAITLPPVTSTVPGIAATAVAQGSADCAAIDPAMPTPIFDERGGLACCVPISTMAGGAMVQVC